MEIYTAPFVCESKAGIPDEKGYFEGYGSTFGGDPDSGGDVVVRGAFFESLIKGGRNGSGVAMLWQHDHKQPLGVWDSLAENERGLKVAGRLALGTQIGDYAHVVMKMKALQGLSIGYDTIEAEPGKGKIKRLLKKVELWEISPVTFAMNTRASITRVKSLAEAKTPRELEDALRDAGLSREEAKYAISICRQTLREAEKDDGKSLSPMTEILKLTQELNALTVQQSVKMHINSLFEEGGRRNG